MPDPTAIERVASDVELYANEGRLGNELDTLDEFYWATDSLVLMLVLVYPYRDKTWSHRDFVLRVYERFVTAYGISKANDLTRRHWKKEYGDLGAALQKRRQD